MRCLLSFGAVLVALGVFRLVGCSEETPLPLECVEDPDCDDANECTDDSCVEKQRWLEGEQYGRCENSPALEGILCDFNGVEECTWDGICVADVCEKNPCDDGNECTVDRALSGGRCEHDEVTETDCACNRNGESGLCLDGVCEEDPCKGVVCDDGDLCTNGWCDVFEGGVCKFYPVNCGDGNFCTDDTCDPDTGCFNTPKPDGQPCCYRGHWECDHLLCFWQDWVCDVAGECDSGACVE